MALQSGNSGSNNDSKLIVLTPKAQDKDKNLVKPYFQVAEKVDDKWVVSDDKTIDRVSGKLKRVVAKEKVFSKNGQVIDTKDVVELYVDDVETNETYLISFNYKISTRRLFVRLLALNSFDNIQISYWRDKEGYDVLTLRQNDELVKAKYTKEEMPESKEVTVNKVKMRDNSELDAFLKEELLKLNDKIQSGPKPEPKVVEKVSAKTKVKTAVSEGEDLNEDDIPF